MIIKNGIIKSKNKEFKIFIDILKGINEKEISERQKISMIEIQIIKQKLVDKNNCRHFIELMHVYVLRCNIEK